MEVPIPTPPTPREVDGASILHIMNFRLGRRLPASCTSEVERDSNQVLQCNQARVQHDGQGIAVALYPRHDELAKSVAPDVLVDGDCDKEGAGHGLVAVDSVGTGDSGERCDLNTGSGEAYDDDCLLLLRI